MNQGIGNGGAGGATDQGRNSSRMLPGLILVGLGLVALLANLGFTIAGNLISAAIFGGLAYFAYQRGVRTGQQGLRLLALGLAGMSVLTLLPGRATGALFLALMGLAFAVVWRTDQRRWWAIIPAGTFASLAATTALSGLPGSFPGFVFLGGLAATFYSLTRLRVGAQPWAIYPAGALAVVAVLALLGGGGSWFFPLALVVVGVILLARSGAIDLGSLGSLGDLLGRRRAPQQAAGSPATDDGASGVPAAPIPPTDIVPADIERSDMEHADIEHADIEHADIEHADTAPTTEVVTSEEDEPNGSTAA